MNQPPITIAIFLSALIFTSESGIGQHTKSIKRQEVHEIVKTEAKIQAAILLDVSNSMDGLIAQAKNELWGMVKVLAKVRCNGSAPPIEIALYEYGRPENDPKDGFVKQISPFTNDLDRLYYMLSGLDTHGGDEFCGHVMYNSLTQLNWDTSSSSYKVIFIAGNESFLQGDIPFTKACDEAKKRGVIVNTIFCGDKERGIYENWNLGAECGAGSYTNIDQDAKEISIPTPYDTTLITLKKKLNQTYLPYGTHGSEYLAAMLAPDTLAAVDANDPTKVMRYIVVKSDKNLNNHFQWDLVDAMERDSTFVEKVDLKTLPDSLQNKSRAQLKRIVRAKADERKSIRNEINNVTSKQDDFIAQKKAKANIHDPKTLGSEIERIVREQVGRFKMEIE
jgi:hypothetical protein